MIGCRRHNSLLGERNDDMLDKFLAIFWYAMFLTFSLVVIFFIKEVDLIIVVIAVAIMAAYDFWLETFSKREKS